MANPANTKLTLTECPRDAMQGLHDFIPTEKKIAYHSALLACGFDTLDFGSYVSPKAIPQLADTAEVLAALPPSPTQLLAIVANQRGAEAALAAPRVAIIGFPLSLSETFQQKNTNRSIAEARQDVAAMHQAAQAAGKTLRVYLSMGFGNPYGDPYSPELVEKEAAEMVALGITEIALADTVGSSTPENITQLFQTLVPALPRANFIAHFHSTAGEAAGKIQAALAAGCRSFDSAIMGLGGCPMAATALTGNIATEVVLSVAESMGFQTNVAPEPFAEAVLAAQELFAHYS